MIFNSITYILLLIVVVSLYWVLPRKPRLLLLLAASVTFYGFWNFAYVPLVLASTAVSYFAARWISSLQDRAERRRIMFCALAIDLALLGFFKYYGFLEENANGFAALLGIDLRLPVLSILLPIGISFYTFHTMSYVIDVYRGVVKPIREITLFGVYVMFFPQLIAGPILRAGEVVWQLDARPRFDPEDMNIGIRRILSGLFLKVVLADNLAPLVDEAFRQNPHLLGPLDTMTMAFLFGFQIYFDFAGYSHIALGSARLMGIKFPENFRFPYLSTSPREFWRRWHISLSSWIRDYLYLPLTGVKFRERSSSTGGIGDALPQTASRATLALFGTWAIMGLWHGAAWTFVLWGLWHAALVQAQRMTGALQMKLPQPIRSLGGWAVTLVLVMLAWIPFRAHSLADAMTLLGHLVQPTGWTSLGLRENLYLVAALVMALVLLAPFAWREYEKLAIRSKPIAAGVDALAVAFTAAMVYVYLRPISQFIYFQF